MTPLRALRAVLFSTMLASALSGCSGTMDSLSSSPRDSGGSSAAGSDGGEVRLPIPDSLRTVTHTGSYYNAFSDLLQKKDGEISSKIDAAFQQLFYGNSDQYIYYQKQTADDRSLIYDIHHHDVRTEGMALAMLITVELDKQTEFDQLWRYSKAKLQQPSGPAQGYFNSYCGDDTAVTDCFDVYGMQQYVLALMLADGRLRLATNPWHPTTDLAYANDALALLDLLQNKELDNHGVVMGIGNAFDATTALVREEPTLADAGFTTRSSLEMPAAYWYWAQATGNPFWGSAEKAARSHLVKAADAMTGLWPMRSYFDGTPVNGSLGFTQQAYRTQLNLALDALWGRAGADEATLAARVLDFFYQQGITSYGGTYEIDGTPIDSGRAQALVSVNGALTVAAPSYANRAPFVQAVWDQAIPTGDNRYYDGLTYLTSLLILSGRMTVY